MILMKGLVSRIDLDLGYVPVKVVWFWGVVNLLLVADLDLDCVCMFSGSNKCFLWNLPLTLSILKGTTPFLEWETVFVWKLKLDKGWKIIFLRADLKVFSMRYIIINIVLCFFFLKNKYLFHAAVSSDHSLRWCFTKSLLCHKQSCKKMVLPSMSSYQTHGLVMLLNHVPLVFMSSRWQY